MAKIKVASIGYGHLGRWHAQKVQACAAAELVAVVEKAPAAQAAAKEAGLPVVSDLAEVLAQIDAAIIATPTSTHFEVALALLNAGKHVFCEKPVTVTSAQAAALQSAALKVPGLVFQVGHSERFHEVWEWWRGEHTPPAWPEKFDFKGPSIWRFNRLAAFKGRAMDVDVVADLMIHDIDLMLWLLQEIPTEVAAWGYKIRTNKWDHVTAAFKFARGNQVFITAGRNWGQEVRSVDVVNEQGSWQIDLFAQKVVAAGKSNDPASFTQTFAYNKRDHLLLEQENFYQAIQEQRRPIISLEDGKNAVAVAEMVLAALDQR